MLFAEEDAPQLKKWIVKRLENTSDADADVLADYVLALLRHDGDIATVRRLCEEEIPDFVKEDSSIFVRDVFDAIQYKSYLPGAAPLPKFSDIATYPATSPYNPSAPSYGSLGLSGAPRGPQNGSRKRSYNDRGDSDFSEGKDYQVGGDANGRAFKQVRRGGIMGRGGRLDVVGAGRGGWQSHLSPPINLPTMPIPGFPNMPPMPSPPPGMPPIDPNNPMAAILAMQAMGFPVTGMPGFSSEGSPIGQARSPGGGPFSASKPKQRCRDYDTKGFCARGNTCMYEHGNDSIYVPPNNDEYDPTNSSLVTGPSLNAGLKMSASSPTGDQNTHSGDRGRGRGRGRGDRGGSYSGPSRRGGRAEFSSDRPSFDKSRSTIVVERIPEEKFSEDAVRAFFSEFGTIVQVDMRPYKRLAIIKYDSWDAAKAAYSSPKAIFDDRFVKVYWFTDTESLPKPPTSVNTSGTLGNGNGTPTPVPARANSEPQLDFEEFTRKQEELQKAHEEKMKRKAEMENAQKELERRKEELQKNQAEEKRKLMMKIAAKSGKSGSTSAPGHDSDQGDKTEKPISQTEVLKAQLAALQAEAQSLGIDAAAGDEASWNGRGRGRGRGEYRGGYRGRGAFVSRGRGFDRGGFRGGRGGAPYGPSGGAYKLDNRPKKIVLTGIDFTNSENDENLRQYLLGIGEFTDIEASPHRTSITFKDRFTAEKFMYGTPNSEIPSAGKVEMAWVQTPLLPVNVMKQSAPSANPEHDGDAMQTDENDDLVQDPPQSNAVRQGHNHVQGHGQERHQDLDYDVADDNDWGNSEL